MSETKCYFITWTTYGTWLPGDARGWRKRDGGHQIPNSRLEEWCRKQMRGEAVLLAPHDREAVEKACQAHCDHRGWTLIAVSARTNHVHVIVISDAEPNKTRDQLKANCTLGLRQQERPLVAARPWTRLGDVEILDTDEDIEACYAYVTEAQDRMSRADSQPSRASVGHGEASRASVGQPGMREHP